MRKLLGFSSQAALGAALGDFNFGQVSRAERGDNPVPPEMLQALAERFHVNINYVLTGEGDWRVRKTGEPEPAEADAEGRALPSPAPGDQSDALPYKVMRTIEPGYREVSPEEIVGNPAGRYVPVIGRIAAGPGIDTAEADAYAVRSAATWLEYRGAPPGAFAIRIAGDSMAPQFRSGDMVVADPGRPVSAGLACARYLDAGGDIVAALKMVRREGAAWVLSSLRGSVRPIRVPVKNVLSAYGVRETLPRIVEKTHW